MLSVVLSPVGTTALPMHIAGKEGRRASFSKDEDSKAVKMPAVGAWSKVSKAPTTEKAVATVDSVSSTSMAFLASLRAMPTVKVKRLDPRRVNKLYNGEISTDCGTKPQYVLIRDVTKNILFSQTNVSDFYRDKNKSCTFPLDYLADSMFIEFRRDGVLDIVHMGDGYFASVDNRRLLIAKKISVVDRTYGIWVRVHEGEDKLSPGLNKRFLGAETWEEAIHGRLGIGGMGCGDHPKIMSKGKVLASQTLPLSVDVDLSALHTEDRLSIAKSKTPSGRVQI